MNTRVWTLNKSFLILSYGSVVIISFLMVIAHITGLTTSPYYATPALLYFFLSTIFIFFIALENTAATFVVSFTLTTAFSQRFIVTYFYPENLDFTNRLKFTPDELDFSMLFYSGCVAAALGGFFIANFFPKIRFSASKGEGVRPSLYLEYIHFFGFKLNSIKFLKIIISFYLLLVILKILIISTTGIGLTGAIHTSDQSLMHWLSSRSGVIGGYAFFSVLLLREYDKETKLVKIFFTFYFLENLLMASRAFFLSLTQGFTISFYILKKRIKIKYIIIGIIILLLSATLYYTALTIVRGYLLTGEIYISQESAFLSISRGFSQLEPLFLWIDMPSTLYQGSVGFFADITLFINSFAIGDLIPDPNRVNLGKLMVQYGRQDDFDIFALAGHAENPGAFATSYMYLGMYGGIVYWFLLGIFLKILDRSDIHLFWKFAFVNSFAYGPVYTLYTTGAALIAPMVLIGFAVVMLEVMKFIKFVIISTDLQISRKIKDR